jgi:hypothetical protein
LQENVPPQPFETVRATIESELGKPLREVFKSFDRKPLGAASIGQVHRATLHDGTPVVVKVQYPDTERFFRLDFQTLMWLFQQVNPEIVPILRDMQKCFVQEFDYKLEAGCLRRMCDNVRPKFRRLSFPEPYDASHGNLPRTVKTLVTRRVLVMDLCPGRSLNKIGHDLLQEHAASLGQTVSEFKATLAERMKDPEFVQEIIAKRAPTELQMAVYRQFLHVRDLLRNAWAACWNWTWALLLGGAIPYSWSSVPPNGPALMKRLFDIHAYSVFEYGSFNADPHAGNILFDDATGMISLIDYGQLLDCPLKKRIAFARLIIAQLDGDIQACKRCYDDLGIRLTMKKDVHIEGGINARKGEVNNAKVCYAVCCMHMGGTPGLAKMLEMNGFESFAEALGPEAASRCQIEFDNDYAMVLRMVFCLKGVGDALGASGVPPGQLMRPAAERFLATRGLKPY